MCKEDKKWGCWGVIFFLGMVNVVQLEKGLIGGQVKLRVNGYSQSIIDWDKFDRWLSLVDWPIKKPVEIWT